MVTLPNLFQVQWTVYRSTGYLSLKGLYVHMCTTKGAQYKIQKSSIHSSLHELHTVIVGQVLQSAYLSVSRRPR